MDNTIQGFAIGITIGSIVGGYFGYQYGLKVKGEELAKPEFRIVFASVILLVWALAQLLSLLFSNTVDPWLNTLMGIVAGFFFGDGLVEKYKGDKKSGD